GPRIREHAAHLLFEHRRLAQSTASCKIQQRIVRDAAPQEEREPRRELVIADRVYRARRHGGRLVLDAHHEFGARENPMQRALDAGLEASLTTAGLVEVEEALQIRGARRLPVRTACQRRQNTRRAWSF